MARPADTSDLSQWVDAQGPATTPLDAAVDYVRGRLDRVVPGYALAMLPHAVLSVMLIDVLVAGQRSRVAPLCVGLLGATVWRWAWLSRLQAVVQAELRGTPVAGLAKRLPAILWTRLAANILFTWGGVVVFPSFYGLMLGGFAAPLLLDTNDPTAARLKLGLGWIQAAAGRLVKAAAVLSIVTLLALTAAFVSQAVLAHTVLPSLLGMNTVDLLLTLNSPAWSLRLCYFVGLAIDAYWTVACVFLYYDSQSRRLATDLQVRLQNLETTEGAA